MRRVHPYAWLWEPLAAEASFVLRPMFGTKAVYLDSRLMLCFSAQAEPWRGVLVCMDRIHQASLMAEFPLLSPHPVLPKWLYLPESADDFERVAEGLVALVRRRDPRIGVEPRPRKRRRSGDAGRRNSGTLPRRRSDGPEKTVGRGQDSRPPEAGSPRQRSGPLRNPDS